MRQAFLIAAALALAATIAGCGEREQSALYKDGRYRGEPDTRSWDNAPPPRTRTGASVISLRVYKPGNSTTFVIKSAVYDRPIVQIFSGSTGSEYGTLSDVYYAQAQWFF